MTSIDIAIRDSNDINRILEFMKIKEISFES